MKSILSAILLVALVTSAQAQDAPIRKIIMTADIVQTDGTRTKAFIHSITDSAVHLMDVKQPIYSNVKNAAVFSIAPAAIKTIKISRKGQGGRGLAIGALSGIAAGAIIGAASYRDPGPDAFFDFGPGFDALGGAVVGFFAGSITGLIIGSDSKKYRVNGDMAQYQYMLERFYKRVKRKQQR